MFKIGVNLVNEEAITRVLEKNRNCPFFFLEGNIVDGDGFYREIRDNFPLDPVLRGDSIHWDALADSLWGGIFNLEKPDIFILWRGSSKMKENDEKNYFIAIEVLESIASTLNNPKYAADRSINLFILIQPTE